MKKSVMTEQLNIKKKLTNNYHENQWQFCNEATDGAWLIACSFCSHAAALYSSTPIKVVERPILSARLCVVTLLLTYIAVRCIFILNLFLSVKA